MPELVKKLRAIEEQYKDRLVTAPRRESDSSAA